MGIFGAKGLSEPSDYKDAEERAKQYQAAIDQAVSSTPTIPNILGAPGTVYAVGAGGNTLGGAYYDANTDTYRHQNVMLEQLHRVIQQKDEQIKKLHEHYGDLSVDSRTGRKRLIEGRLRQSVDTSFQYFDTAYVGDVVHVFLVVNDQTLGLTDEFAMFPSDNLITQLRLLMK